MSIAVGHAWLQKHPTPSAAAGEFHWHGEGAAALAPGEQAALRGRVVEEVQKLAAPAVWWELTPRRVIWAAVFSAISPTDARPYRGVALTVATGGAPPAAMLAQLTLAAAAPFGARPTPAGREPLGTTGGARAAEERGAGAHGAELARAVLSGGAATVDDPHDPRLPRALAALLRALPPELQDRPVSGQLTDAATTMLADRGGDAVAELLARVGGGEGGARRGGGEADRAAWQLLCELAASDARASAAAAPLRAEVLLALLDELLAESQRAHGVRFPDRASQRFERALRAWTAARPGAAPTTRAAAAGAVAGPTSWRQLLHGWGRGWLGDDAALTARLAEELALRALGELGRGGQAQSALAEARWQALLPAQRRRALWQELARRAPCLADEGPFPRPLPRSRQESFHAT